MQRYIALENIKRYKQQLSETADAAKMATLRQLLAEEETRLAAVEAELKVPQGD